jgi:hypothetical protein
MPAQKDRAAGKASARQRGRPSKYRDEFPEQARKLCLLGATDEDMARFFEVAKSTITLWVRERPNFSAAIKDGKMLADATIADSLYQRAKGYSHRSVKIMVVDKCVEQVPFIEHYPPDPTSMIFWLKNRRPDLWREKQLESSAMTPEEAAQAAQEAIAAAMATTTASSANGSPSTPVSTPLAR